MRFIATAQPFSRNRETELLIRAARTRKLENRYRFLSIRGVSFDVSRPWSSEIICCLFPFFGFSFRFQKINHRVYRKRDRWIVRDFQELLNRFFLSCFNQISRSGYTFLARVCDIRGNFSIIFKKFVESLQEVSKFGQ